MRIVLAISVFWVVTSAKRFSYIGYQVLELNPYNKCQLHLLKSLAQNGSFDFWSYSNVLGTPSTVMVPPRTQMYLIETLDAARIPYTVIIRNVERAIQKERYHQFTSSRTHGDGINFNAYNRYDAIQKYLKELSVSYPDIVALEDIGKSYEGRKITMIKIGTGNSTNSTMLIDAGIHAREWITPAFALYLIRELVEKISNRKMIEDVNWYIIPVINPDGYEYSHTTRRLWRKTRSLGKKYYGVDANRNFDFHWGEEEVVNMEQDESYPGPSAFSESEARALRDVVYKYADQIKLYLTVHSYGGNILYPWGYTKTMPKDFDELDTLAKAAAAAITSVSGTRYEVGSPGKLLYIVSGATNDWVKAIGKVELSYAIELPGGGMNGFDLPLFEIENVCLETLEGLKVFHNHVVDKFK